MSDIAPAAAAAPAVLGPPRESLLGLFLRFLRFGCLAWGGPVAQIAMIRHALVEEERWIDRQHFNRVLAIYQLLPGPEAHELCVYFGMLARGRCGGFVAGLGFMLPGLVLVLLLAWAYGRYGFANAQLAPVLASMQVAVAALIVRAAARIGEHALLRPRLIAVAAIVGAAMVWWQVAAPTSSGSMQAGSLEAPSSLRLLLSGAKAGLLSFGGAYTAIPLVQQDAVLSAHAWMTPAQFLDAVALSGLLPAPLIIFATFVGYVGGGLAGGLLITSTVFAPAFGFTLLGHDFFARAMQSPRLREWLDLVMAAVVGLIGATAAGIAFATLTTVQAGVLFVLLLSMLFMSRSPWAAPIVIAVGAAWGAAWG